MSDDKQLTEEEARRFLELLDKVEADMETAFDEVTDSTFGDADTSDGEFHEKWGASAGSLYTTYTRKKYRRFVENAYLDDEE